MGALLTDLSVEVRFFGGLRFGPARNGQVAALRRGLAGRWVQRPASLAQKSAALQWLSPSFETLETLKICNLDPFS